MVRGTMKASKFLTICLLVIISGQAWGSRVFWLKEFGRGSLSFWQNKNLPNSSNLCRNGLGKGSKFFWESCSYDPANPTVLMPGTKAFWENGYGSGSRRYWNSAITRFNGMSHQEMCTSPYGYKPGMKLYYTHCTGPGSLAYWNSGTERGSSIYWKAGTGQSIASDWVGPCMDAELDTVWCAQMRKDVQLQNTSILDWMNANLSSLSPGIAGHQTSNSTFNPCYAQAVSSTLSQQSLSNLVNATVQALNLVEGE